MASLNFDIFARDKTAQAFASVKNNVDGLNKGFGNISKTVSAFKTLLVGAFAINYLKGAAEAAEQINDLSTKLAISAEVLSQYQLVANNTGVELSDIGTAMQKLAKSSVDAAEKGGEAAEALSYLGINAKQFATLPIDTKFQLLATAINGVEDPSKRVQLAMTLMGRSGADMLQVMAGGGKALQEMQQRADELGITLTQTQVGAIDGMMDSFGELGLAAKGVAQDLIGLFAPAIQAIAQALTYVLVGAVNITKKGFMSLIATILDLVGRTANAFAWLTRQLSILPGAAGDAMKSISQSLSNYGDILTSVSSEAEDATQKNSAYQAGLDKTAASINKVNEALNKPSGAGKHLKGAKRHVDDLKTALNKSDPAKPLKDSKRSIEDVKNTASAAADDIAVKWGESADSIENDMSRALSGINVDFKDLRGTAVSALNSIGDALLQNLARQLGGSGGTGMSFGGTSGGGGGGNDLLGQAAGSLLSSAIGGILGFASGGDHAGGLRIVGENGPELEATGSSRIFNAAQTKNILAGIGSGSDGTISIVYNIDARGADQGVEERVMASLKKMNSTVEARAIAAVANAKRRNPNLL